MALGPGTKLGPYEILGPIGAGGMGEVYRARDERLAREVAVKVLPSSFLGDPDRLRRFEQEARATGQLNHPNILAVYDTGTHEGAPYVVEELLEGETLRQKISGTPLPSRKAIDYARQIAEGLAAAHQKGIVHRDLKPENLFITRDGRVKILDFGLAKLTRPEDLGSAMTAAPTQVETDAGVVLGTVGYMSPEQVRGQPADHRSDIFSFGGILYEMLAGRRAFQAGSSVETMNAILKEEPLQISGLKQEIPTGLERIVFHCMEKSPEERFQSARDLAFQLEALSGSSVATAGAAPAKIPAKSSLRWILPGAILMIAVSVSAYMVGRLSRPEPVTASYDRLTFRQGTLFSARFTPDGQTVVYAAGWDGSPTEVFTVRPGSPESRPLGLSRAEVVSVSPSGELAVLLDPYFTLGWMRSGTLARLPLAGGAPRPVLENVQGADWSPDGKGLAVVRRVEGKNRLEYPTGNVLYETEGWISSPRFSRDGTRIAFIDHPGIGDDRGRVGVVELSGNARTLTVEFHGSQGLAWSPAGDEIWFTASGFADKASRRDRALRAVDLQKKQRVVSTAPTDVTLLDVSSDGRVLMTRDNKKRGIRGRAPGEEDERDLSWLNWSRPADLSGEGEWVLFEEQDQGGERGYSVYLRRTDGSPAVLLGEGYAYALSPDGQWIMTYTQDAPGQLTLLPRGPGEPRTVPIPGLELSYGSWFPGGEKILLLASENRQPLRLYVMDGEGAQPRPISPAGVRYAVAISPDGTMVAASQADDVPRIYPAEGGDPLPITGAEPHDVVVGWGRGSRAVFVAQRAQHPQIVNRIDLHSGERSEWLRLEPADGAGLIDIGFIHLSDDALSYAYSYRRILATLYLVEGLR